jgi:hypothetical protein
MVALGNRPSSHDPSPKTVCYTAAMENSSSYILTCVICGRKMKVPERYLEPVLAKFKCQKRKSLRRPIVQPEENT